MSDLVQQAYDKGFEAFGSGSTQDNNPYPNGLSAFYIWIDGWTDAQTLAQREKDKAESHA